MQKIIVEIPIGDGCTYNCIITSPIFAESTEAAELAFDNARKNAGKNEHGYPNSFIFAGEEFVESEIERNGEPVFFTIDEYFDDAVQID